MKKIYTNPLQTLAFFLLFFSFLSVSAQPPGTLDPTFGDEGKVVTSLSSGQDKIYGMVLLPDEKILVAGYSTSSITGKDFACARYNTDGSLDTSFGTGGSFSMDVQLGSEDIAYDLDVQTDGKILLAGASDDGADQAAAIIRLSADGVLDTTFGTAGVVLSHYEPAQADEIRVIKVHPLTGNIIVGGATIISSTKSKPVVARYLMDGTLDTSFNGTGFHLLWITSLDYQYLYSVEDLVVQPNGKITAVGWRDFPGLSWSSDYWTVRISSDGTMDPTYSVDGLAIFEETFNGHDRGHAMLLKPDNSIIMAGGSHLSTLWYDFRIFGIDADGTSGTYATRGDFGEFDDDRAYGLAEDMNGKYVMSGSSVGSSGSTFAILRAESSSNSRDATFGSDGMVTTTFDGNVDNEAFDVVVQSDNKIIAAGYTGDDFALARYMGDGMATLNEFELLDPTFGETNVNYAALTYNWTDAYGATSYEIEYDSSADFTASPVLNTVSMSSYNMGGLAPSTDYWWRVRASDGTTFGDWSDVWPFTTKNAPDPIPVDPAIEQNFNIYPNPAKEYVRIDVETELIWEEWTIFSQLGKKVLNGILTESSNDIPLQKLETGIYFLRIGESGNQAFRILKK